MRYTAEIDRIDRPAWDDLLQEFCDTTIFQTWGYGVARWGERNLSHAVIKRGGETVGLAQVVLVGVPLAGKVLAFVNCGPLWQRSELDHDVERFNGIVEALRQEYVIRRGLLLRLRVWPYDLPDAARTGFAGNDRWAPSKAPLTTYILDLSRPEADLRRALDKKWRANLRKSEQAGLSVSEPPLSEGIDIFSLLHRDMTDRKGFPSDFMKGLPQLCETLPAALRPRIFVCWHGAQPVASAVVSAIGDRAFYLNGASGEAALPVRGGYRLQWEVVRWLREATRCRWYDLYGAMSSAGVRQFKRGLVGPHAEEITVPEFEACESALAKLVANSASNWFRSSRSLSIRAKRMMTRSA